MFWKIYKDKVDEWIIYYNSDEVFEEIADTSTIYDQEKFNEFKKDIVDE